MTDVFSPEKRSEIMSGVKSSGNAATELRLIAILKRERIWGWRRNFKLIGKPDFVFPVHRVALFVDGCFWHGCRKHGTIPQTNSRFWTEKIARNQRRDRLVAKCLREKNWTVIRLWQHELKDGKKVAAKIRRVLA